MFGDIDGDSDLDLVYTTILEDQVFLNDGTGTFQDLTAARLARVQSVTTNAVLADLDGDTDLDLVTADVAQHNRIYFNDGAGSFANATPERLTARWLGMFAVAFADLDGDADLDLVAAGGDVGEVTEDDTFYLNDGRGNFALAAAGRLPLVVDDSRAVALGDVDRDGDIDIVVGNDDIGVGRFNRLYLNDGTGRFTDRDLVYDYYRTFALLLGDVDDDGDLDAICGDYDHYDKLYLNNGQGSFVNLTWPRMGATPNQTVAMALGDVDGDGDLDLVRGSDWRNPTLLMNHHRQVWSPRLPKIGAAWTLEVFSRAGYATATQSALAFLGAAPASFQVLPWGRLGVDPSQLVSLPLMSLPAPGGKGALQVAIPNVPGLVGQNFYVQALVLPTGNLADARFTNTLAERIVR